MLTIEAIHFKLDIKNGKGPNKYQIGKFGVPMYFVKVYQFVGVFLFGAATEQTITNILKFSVGKLKLPIFICSDVWTTLCFKSCLLNIVIVMDVFAVFQADYVHTSSPCVIQQ